MIIIPAIDVFDGKLVRLEKGSYQSQKIYSENPFVAAKQFADYGFDLIHIVDLSGSRDGRISILELLKEIKSQLKIKIQFGGGIRSLDDAMKLFDTGVDKIVIGSISISNKSEFGRIVQDVGVEKIVVAVDTEDERIKIKGWTESTDLNIYDHLIYCLSKGVDTFLCTDIKRDGMLTGPNLKLYHNLMKQFPLAKIIASGGVSKIEDVRELKSLALYGVVIGKAIYENKIQLKELTKLAGKKNNPMP
ncbi:MAG: 1-(5-phosphoribosyl)-5-[(5-phosphoribosylamino)methylideneamino]imidazole-4-carboxamide isomerase [Ignavibacteria bacterium RIFOXYB2_FULL_35_12]|nr:MAG: 1-(5-phosphoribosyl)-5-[(5-phosphoribosylamino)methylideneamino]imidazole-4-carboxamide isomerase [Ignavibacteria bacterium GWA2_36_19]OGU53004.1 MAG: 1-(5-phosphoribosyl)-5-[(5-phosphoribosylamino)methylideneamino]imidazole-4-carboxamide isomerase [Ignavibacteria bacterium GWC2_35_8]OGU56019.1 MAG: 1-(5-phosphoribosyl)-5-[(5-phosphoribosylamino)methylideneamino]imidazole-4-carboxamide isomerase [Ignavibacteria bacterium GWF2_35_20]OGU77536.1 MAG: 1-(5-phosphoribosyl)-5-[(5-phosphoribosy